MRPLGEGRRPAQLKNRRGISMSKGTVASRQPFVGSVLCWLVPQHSAGRAMAAAASTGTIPRGRLVSLAAAYWSPLSVCVEGRGLAARARPGYLLRRARASKHCPPTGMSRRPPPSRSCASSQPPEGLQGVAHTRAAPLESCTPRLTRAQPSPGTTDASDGYPLHGLKPRVVRRCALRRCSVGDAGRSVWFYRGR